jgi:hypothetical protein
MRCFLVLGAQPFQHGRMHHDAELEIRFVARAFLQDFLELALDFHAHGDGALDLAAALAIRAVVIDGGAHAFGVALARHFHQAELRDGQDVRLGLVAAQAVLHALIDLLLVAARFHVNEIEHDEAAHVAQAQLAADFLGGLEVDRRMVDSWSRLPLCRPVFTSMATSASVSSMTM